MTDFLLVGKIARAHGVRGELKVRLFFDGSQSLFAVDELELRGPKGEKRTEKIEAVRGTAKAPILALFSVQSKDQADALKDWEIAVQRSALPPLEPGEYYLVDTIGCDVYIGERLVGRVSMVRPDPSVDTLVIAAPDGKKLEQPLIPHFVGKVDTAGRRIELLNDDGLID